MSMGSPDMPEPKTPAKRPERKQTVQPEDIVVADSDQEDSTERRGRRALRRPASPAQGSTSVGTGLSA